MIRANMKAFTLIVGNIPFENKLSHFSGSDLGTLTAVFLIAPKNRTPQSLTMLEHSAHRQCSSINADYDWQLAHERGRVCVEALLSINNRGRGVRFIDVTKTNGSIWGRGKHIRRLKQKHWMDFYHYMMVVYRHCQHTFQYNQLVKVHVPLYDPFKTSSPL